MDDSLSNSHLEPNLDKNAASYFNSFERVSTFKQLAHDSYGFKSMLEWMIPLMTQSKTVACRHLLADSDL